MDQLPATGDVRCQDPHENDPTFSAGGDSHLPVPGADVERIVGKIRFPRRLRTPTIQKSRSEPEDTESSSLSRRGREARVETSPTFYPRDSTVLDLLPQERYFVKGFGKKQK